MDDMKTRIESVNNQISSAATRAGRSPSKITLVAVSKRHPVSAIEKASKQGLTDFGENRADEFYEKYQALGEGVIWHYIGHLQRNKAKQVAGRASLIHSVDSVRVAREIDKRTAENSPGKKQNVLLQLNISGEEQKYGFAPDELDAAIESISRLENIHISGIMVMAPNADDPEEIRWVFKKAKEIFDGLSDRKMPGLEMKYLSMGMTNDMEVAIEEGSNMVRVGTAIFGPREY